MWKSDKLRVEAETESSRCDRNLPSLADLALRLSIYVMANHGFLAIYFRLGFISLLIGLTSCSGVTAVQDVRSHPHRNWLTSTVYLRGQVSDRIPLINAQVYQLQDGTGKIWVLTDKSTPKVGDRVYIKGQVRYGKIPIESQDFGEAYIEEQEIKEQDIKEQEQLGPNSQKK